MKIESMFGCGIEVPGRHGPRISSREPSYEIINISRQAPDLYFSSNGDVLCRTTPINLIGSLLIQRHWDEIVAPFKKLDIPIPEKIQTPIEIVRGVRVLYELKDNAYEPTDFEADEVMIKRGCGTTAGLVIRGPMTGLILGEQPLIKPNGAMVARRVWNNHLLLNETEHPYDFVQEHHVKKYLGESAKKFAEQQVSTLIQIFNDLKKEVSDKLKLESVTTYELFLYLCQELNIKVDTDEFHFTYKSYQ